MGLHLGKIDAWQRRIGFLIGIPLLLLFLSPATKRCQGANIDIISKNLSHRVLALDTVETRLKLMIGFSVNVGLPSGPAGTSGFGRLSHLGSEVSTFTIPKLDHYGGNLIFYLPYDIAPGDYALYVELTDISSGSTVATRNYTVQDIETVSHLEGGSGANWMQPPSIPLRNPTAEPLGASATPEDTQRGYILWHRNPFEYVYPNSAPDQNEVISSVTVRLAKQEYEPATFSLYALEDLGNVSVAVSDLSGAGSATLTVDEVYTVRTVPRCKSTWYPENGYEMRPRLLDKDGPISVEEGASQRFWLTVHADADTPSGDYSGEITVTTGLGSTEIPFTVEVLPFSLMERPDKEYGFEMTYVFQEMTSQDLTAEERNKIYENGLKYYHSFRNHGLTTIIPHSPFCFRRLPDGSPDLRDLQAALTAFNAAGFTGPFIYYCGHLVQSSKPGWAGSTLGYDEDFHPPLMKEIISYARQNFPEMASVDFHWMPGDEVHDDRGGPDRLQIGEDLLNAAWEMNEKTAISVKAAVDWPVDIKFDDLPLYGEPWDYPNEATLPISVDDPEILRKTFGLNALNQHYVGIAPWTFQTSENAGGDPYTDLDAIRRPEVMIAYPGTDGPMPTPEYEAIREGIDDGRYAYVLETRIENAMNSTDPQLQDLADQAQAALEDILNNIDGASLADMDEYRETMVTWIMQLGGFYIPLPAPEAYGRILGGDQTHINEVNYSFDGMPGEVTLYYQAWDVDFSTEVEILVNGESVGYAPTTANETWGSTQSDCPARRLRERLVRELPDLHEHVQPTKDVLVGREECGDFEEPDSSPCPHRRPMAASWEGTRRT